MLRVRFSFMFVLSDTRKIRGHLSLLFQQMIVDFINGKLIPKAQSMPTCICYFSLDIDDRTLIEGSSFAASGGLI